MALGIESQSDADAVLLAVLLPLPQGHKRCAIHTVYEKVGGRASQYQRRLVESVAIAMVMVMVVVGCQEAIQSKNCNDDSLRLPHRPSHVLPGAKPKYLRQRSSFHVQRHLSQQVYRPPRSSTRVKVVGLSLGCSE
jgi:hypothetical protein